MKEEEYRQALAAGVIGAKRRLNLIDIMGWNNLYKTSPSSAVGQFVFACYPSAITMGMCTTGSQLVPWGVRGCMTPNQSSGCATSSCFVNGYSFGTGTYVALGATGDCGATLWRRIA
jgi:hypothetical protein